MGETSKEGGKVASYRKYDIHEGIIFLIELSEGMFHELTELDGGVQIIEILSTLLKLMSQLVITRPGTGIGCYFYNSYSNNADGNGIFEYITLRDINARDMKQLSDLLEDVAYGRIKLKEYLSFNSEKRTPLESIFEFLKAQFIRDIPGEKTFNNKKVFLFTDNDSPPESKDPDARSRLNHLVSDLDDYYIGFTTFFIGSEHSPFDDTFYSEILRLGAHKGSEFDGPNTKPISASLIKARVLRKQEIKRVLFQCPIILQEESGFTVGIKGYSIVSHEKAGVRYKLVYENEDVRREAFSTRKYLDASTGEEIREGLTKVFAFGDLDIELTDEELTAVAKDYAGANSSLKVIGFRSTDKCLHYFNSIDKAAFVVPDESSYQGSIRTMASLFKNLRKRNKSAIVWGKLKTNSNPAMFVLVPSDSLSRNEGFYLSRIPFLDEIRKLPHSTPSDYQMAVTQEYYDFRELTKKVVAHFNLKNGYEPAEFRNPTLQRHFKILHDYLLQVEADRTSDLLGEERDVVVQEDDSLRKLSQIRDKIIESADSEDTTQNNLSDCLFEWNKIYQSISVLESGKHRNVKKARTLNL